MREVSGAGGSKKQLEDLTLAPEDKGAHRKDSPSLAEVVTPPVVGCSCRGPGFLSLRVLLPRPLLLVTSVSPLAQDPPLVAGTPAPDSQSSPRFPLVSGPTWVCRAPAPHPGLSKESFQNQFEAATSSRTGPLPSHVLASLQVCVCVQGVVCIYVCVCIVYCVCGFGIVSMVEILLQINTYIKANNVLR